MPSVYFVVGANPMRPIRCVGAMVMMLVCAKLDECGEAVNVYADGECPGNPDNAITAYEWMREWSDADEWMAWENDATTRDWVR